MAFSIYKPGQGYWTRMLTAIGAGIVVMATVGWLWAELDSASFAVERAHKMPLPSLGQDVDDASDSLVRWGIHLADAGVGEPGLGIERIEPGSEAQKAKFSRDDVITSVNGSAVADRAALASVLSQLEPEKTLTIQVGRRESIVLYVQAGVAVFVIMVAGIVLWLIMNRPRAVDFMIATEAEMRKVNWPSRNEIRGSTVVVVCGTIILSLFLWTINMVFGWLFIQINILESS